ncbi:non-ribosomal peptide synthetase [Actinoplanes sp. N902-109]|uniref:non-ribosomal peptide synthetase n=1 Tax=Actinoplanes sp. (strain N902-109) TaxID=649831 RepID=UPI0003293E8C|nr:non-ribosomal peptide synthetase [Actinoplanes sp. N902-109]AGL16561.1 amino acid adenylation domain-containing protein [Actinoplanes sp. N902-109]
MRTDPAVRVPELIRARVQATPGAVALRTSHDEVTYEQLWQRAGQLSRQLGDLGVATGDIVALRLPPGPEVITAMLGVWLAGAAFLPMDTAAPAGYHDQLLHDSGAVAVIGTDGPVPLRTGTDAVAAAYVIYTSGSTGRPKGVLVGHRALAGHSIALAQLLGLRPEDTVLQFASLGFDVAQEEIWPTLSAGATVALRPVSSADPAELAGHVQALGVTILQLPTAYWRVLSAQGKGTTDPSYDRVRTVMIGGESATAQDVRMHRAGPLRHCTLVNGYGPTETVITATALVLPPRDAIPDSTGLPIGRPVGERLLHVLDPDGRPVADGTAGELWIGGPLLADGYLNDPARTAERFSGHPRRYRTGDLVVRHPHGDLEFLGRLDNQVKVRGHRIELDEVDRHLLDTPGVTAAVSVTLDDGAGGLQLGAGLSLADNTLSAAQIRERLRRRLPAYLVPGPMLVLPALPVTASGKIDRRAVARLIAADLDAAGTPDGAGQPVADQLVDLLRNLLRVPTFGLDDDFVLHGGDSLMALGVSGTMRARGWPLRPSALMTDRTPRKVAERLV